MINLSLSFELLLLPGRTISLKMPPKLALRPDSLLQERSRTSGIGNAALLDLDLNK